MSPTNFYRYRTVPSTDVEIPMENGDLKPLKPHYLRNWKIVSVMAVLAIGTIAIITTLTHVVGVRVHRTNIHDLQWKSFTSKHCGNSAEEARRRGCRFEMHNFAWVPPECYDEELGRDWDSHNGWEFSWAANDSSATSPSFVQQCRAGDVEAAWVPWFQHMAHCSLIMKKYMRSVMFDRPMDNWTSNWHHNEHCTNMMARPNVNPLLINSLLHLKFPSCDYSWKTDRPASMDVKPTYES